MLAQIYNGSLVKMNLARAPRRSQSWQRREYPSQRSGHPDTQCLLCATSSYVGEFWEGKEKDREGSKERGERRERGEGGGGRRERGEGGGGRGRGEGGEGTCPV